MIDFFLLLLLHFTFLIRRKNVKLTSERCHKDVDDKSLLTRWLLLLLWCKTFFVEEISQGLASNGSSCGNNLCAYIKTMNSPCEVHKYIWSALKNHTEHDCGCDGDNDIHPFFTLTPHLFTLCNER